MKPNNSKLLNGLVAATHTPFHADGSLNLAGVERQAEHLLKNGVRFVFIGGTTGESASLSLEERRQLAQRWMEVARGTPLKVVVHVGSNSLAEARVLAAQAEELGALAIAALAPSYFKPRTLDLLIACCADIASAAPRTPFFYYDIPVLTGVHFSAVDFLFQVHNRIPTLAGIKFSNPDLLAYQFCLRIAPGTYEIPWGTDEYLLAALALGAESAVGSTYNFAAQVYHRMLEAFYKGDITRARREQFQSAQLVQLLSEYGYMGAAKAVMKMLGVDVGPARLPHGNPTAEQTAQLRYKLEKMGFFDWTLP